MEGRWGQRTGYHQVPLVPGGPRATPRQVSHFSTGEDESVFQSFYRESLSTRHDCRDQDGAVNQTKRLPWGLLLVGEADNRPGNSCYHTKVL